MVPDLESSRPKKKLSLTAKIMVGIVVVIGLFLLMPSAKVKRITTARKLLSINYPVVSESTIEPLLKSHLLINDTFIYDAGNWKECAIFIFPPDGPTSQYGDSMLYELNGTHAPPRNASSGGHVPVAVLLAPKESSIGWTLFAKIWIAKALQKQQVQDLKSIGLELSSNPKVMTRLKAIWRKVPAKVKARATEVLEENRAVAKQYEPTPRFYRKGKTYLISKTSDLSDFLYSYNEAYPESESASGN